MTVLALAAGVAIGYFFKPQIKKGFDKVKEFIDKKAREEKERERKEKSDYYNDLDS